MSCSYCGKKRPALKRCSRCKQASYCGAECQNAAWKGHKKTCVTLQDAMEKLAALHHSDWRGVLKWEGRMEEMMEDMPDDARASLLRIFADAHRGGFNATGGKDNLLCIDSIVRLETRHVELLGKMQRFRDQGEVLCGVADHLLFLGERDEAEETLKRARNLAEAHGFFSVECQSCLGLGRLSMKEGRDEEGVQLLRNALVCVPLCEVDTSGNELNVLFALTTALFLTHAIDEVEPLVSRYLEAAKAQSDKLGHLCHADLRSVYTSARLHEVLRAPSRCSHPDEYSSGIRFPIGNWSLSFSNYANGSNALGRNRIPQEYSPGLARPMPFTRAYPPSG